jgi:hypothetical protein
LLSFPLPLLFLSSDLIHLLPFPPWITFSSFFIVLRALGPLLDPLCRKEAVQPPQTY